MAPDLEAFNRVALPANGVKSIKSLKSDNGAREIRNKEMNNNPNKIHVNFDEFYGIKPTNIDRRFDLTLSDLSYLPKVHHPLSRDTSTCLIADQLFSPKNNLLTPVRTGQQPTS